MQGIYVKNFNGKRFKTPIDHPWLYPTKKKAKAWADSLKEGGDLARVVREGNRYRVWMRKLKGGRFYCHKCHHRFPTSAALTRHRINAHSVYG